jgi:tRNA A-37 threonylcarbamoyl transferase component Bud32
MANMDPVSPLPLLLVTAMPTRGRRFLLPLLLGIGLATVFNLPWLAEVLPGAGSIDRSWLDLLSHPSLSIVANIVAGALIVWGLAQLLRSGTPKERLVRTLVGRGDFVGAAQMRAQEGDLRHALALYRKGKAWNEAARVALEMGRDREAADLLRRAGEHHLGEAARLYRRISDISTAQQCDRDHAKWLTSRGRFDEAVEAWMRAGDSQRAAGAATAALEKGRLGSSHRALRTAQRAVEQTGDYVTLARLHEVEGNWKAAAHSWQSAGRHAQAAENFRKAGMLQEAASAEAAAGHPQEAAQLRIHQLDRMRDRLNICRARGEAGRDEADRLTRQIDLEAESLVPILAGLGMRAQMIEVLVATGHVEEAVEKLVQQDEESEAADLATNAQLWHVAAPILERLNRWGEASDIHELAGNIEAAARCAESAGEDERALQLYRSQGMAERTAHCMARLGYLQDALVELHRAGMIGEACEVLQNHPGPIPDIPDVVLDMADWARENRSREVAVACLQRAVIGVALQPGRLGPAVALANELYHAGERDPALAQVERILAFDYSFEPARILRTEIASAREPNLASTRPAAVESGKTPKTDLSAQQRYEILTELGRGGMGVVYKARDTRLERDVAIKVLRTTSSEEAARLEQEAKAAATLNHPGIVTVYDFEAGFDGYFIAMEYVPGEALDHLLKTDPARIRSRLAPLLSRLADAIAYAHAHHVIHRDLKPGNLLVTPNFAVKILDFGIAARLDSGAGESASICGTPFYMAPEQIRGESPTPATDIYAFGATAFHLATGRPPFHTGNVIDAHLNEPPPNPNELAPDLAPDLGRIILRCLEKEPEKRFSDARQLCDSLENLAR